MPTFEITSPDGKTYQIEAPAGATREQAFKYFKQAKPELFAAPAATAEPTAPKFKPELGSLEGMPTQRGVYRVPSAMAMQDVMGTAGGAGEVLQQAASAFGRGIAKIPGQAADLAITMSNLSPSALLGVTPKYEPTVTKTTEEALGLKQTPAAYAPYEFMGGFAGPAITKAAGLPVRGVARAAEGVRNWLNPKALALLEAAGDRGQEIINALRGNVELVPGSAPVAGVAAVPAGAPRYAALQEEVAKVLPAEYYARESQQNAARLGSVRTIGKDEAALAAARGTRAGVTEPLYKAAREGKVPVDTGPVLDKIDDLIAKNPGNPELLTEMQRIRKGLVIPETPMTPELARTKAEEVASSLDGIKAALAKEDNKFITGELTDIKNMLTDAIPGMKAAQETFKTLSKPVNKMEVGQYLEGKLASPLADEMLRPGVFATALENAPATIKRATGMPRFQSLSQVLEPADVAKLDAIREDLARSAEFMRQAKIGRGAGENIPATETPTFPNLMNRITSVANNIMIKLQGKIDRKVAIELATEMLDPKLAADAMEKALAFQAKQAGRRASVERAGEFVNRLALTAGAAAPVNALLSPSQNSLATQTGQ